VDALADGPSNGLFVTELRQFIIRVKTTLGITSFPQFILKIFRYYSNGKKYGI
jgi:hypothetical protein